MPYSNPLQPDVFDSVAQDVSPRRYLGRNRWLAAKERRKKKTLAANPDRGIYARRPSTVRGPKKA